MTDDTKYSHLGGVPRYFGPGWASILIEHFIYCEHGMVDEFENDAGYLIQKTKKIFSAGNYSEIFEFLQWILRHRNCPRHFSVHVARGLNEGRSAYRLLDDKKTIVPIASKEEAAALTQAFSDLRSAQLDGARTHLTQSAARLTNGDCSESIRESISAVESVARMLAPSGKFTDALAELEKSSAIHGALKRGMASIYGYTSDEQGIRHPLLEEANASVDEVDALFMLGACASFITYIISKARQSGLLGATSNSA
jgi:hypothetical protein